MKVHWLIEETHYQNDNNVAQRLMYWLAERGNPVTSFRYIPFEGTEYDFLPKDGPVVFFGTWNALADIRRRVSDPPSPLAWCDLERLRCSTYYEKLKGLILQDPWKYATISEFRNNADRIFQEVGIDDCVFVRPDDNDKIFNGEILKKSNLLGWSRGLEFRQVPDDTMMIVSRPRAIDVEWRFLLVDGRVVGGSQYKTNCCLDIEEGYDPKAADFAAMVARIWSPHPVFIVDVGLASGEYKVVEIGPFNYAGLYKMKLGPIIEAIESHLLPI